jgi:hypothetical protein
MKFYHRFIELNIPFKKGNFTEKLKAVMVSGLFG